MARLSTGDDKGRGDQSSWQGQSNWSTAHGLKVETRSDTNPLNWLRNGQNLLSDATKLQGHWKM